jgi:transcriptional regulator with XRE-family HTH domain
MNGIMIGARLREARSARDMSLNDVAGRAHISVATLSRIERDKQNIELGLFLTLMHILELDPAELLRDADHEREDALEGVDPLVARITSLAAAERAKLWRSLAQRPNRGQDGRAARRNIGLQVEELLAQVEFLHNEIESVRRRLKKK